MSDMVKNLSDGLAAAVETAGASVIHMETRRRLSATGIVWSADGVVVTANHVVDRDDNLSFGLPGGQVVPAKLIGRDPSTDLAVLRAPDVKLVPPTWADPDVMRVGHLVLALGRPGKQVMATLGVISALEDGAQMPGGMPLDRFIQTDVVMYPGFSGGPLVGVSGKVLGLNTSALVRGISLTIPVTTIRRVVETLLTHGKMRRGFLGVGAQTVRLPSSLVEQLQQETGLLVISVEPGSPAEKGGLFMGDTLVSLDDRALRDPDDLIGMLSSDKIGKAITLRLARGGQLQEVKVTIGERE
jgi:S1-C subfamily serine protease